MIIVECELRADRDKNRYTLRSEKWQGDLSLTQLEALRIFGQKTCEHIQLRNGDWVVVDIRIEQESPFCVHK